MRTNTRYLNISKKTVLCKMKIQFKIIIVLLSISAVFAGSAEESECATPEPKKVCTGGPNDGWTNCGSACPLTCEKPVAGVCTKQCILNTCQCQNGTVRASDGQCIKASDCSWYEKKINCTENEKCTAKCTGGVYDKCTLCGTACPLTCDKPKVDVCTLQCKVNVCECQSGTVRDTKTGQCVKPDQCPPPKVNCTGGPYDEYTNCGSSCPLTCDKPKRVDVCLAVCVPNTCECKSPYIRDTKSGQCVKPDQCPPPKANCTGGPYDEYTDCGSLCPPTCDKPEGGICAAVCVENTCQCESPYIRDTKSGQCVKPDQCPHSPECSTKCKGGPHDHCKSCGTKCPATCKTPYPQSCVEVCVKDVCQCDDGWVRNLDGKCIKLDQCPTNTNTTEPCETSTTTKAPTDSGW
ncbi:balbiani ring protein 3-like isoform X2 [Aphidius gifuensis]|uniref:balbiani ring protein 3-like isoform X2 n=1 Tax=Aphidius gifuensis TaxID=684658 RepID=UPI001CDC10B7|nr:balbiani ring protein 3-like isoform X2 [Aphidius gifuensis]